MKNGLIERLQKVIPVEWLNDWERDEIFSHLTYHEPLVEKAVIEQLGIIWPISSALCFYFLDHLKNGLACLSTEQLPDWVKGILDVYEADGLQAARRYMDDVEGNFLCRIRGEKGLTLAEIIPKLLPYIRGLSRKTLDLQPSASLHTDTNTLFLPREITSPANLSHNFYIYKLLASFLWAGIEQDIYCQQQTDPETLENFILSFEDQKLAMACYHLLQTVRVADFLKAYLPGLIRDGQTFFRRLRKEADLTDISPETGDGFAAVRSWLLAHCANDPLPELSGETESIIRKVVASDTHHKEVFAATTNFYERVRCHQEDFTLPCPLFFQGELRPQEARMARLSRREEHKQQFIKALAAVIPSRSAATQTEAEPAEKNQAHEVSESGASVSPMHQDGKKEKPEEDRQDDPRYICLDDEHLELPEELRHVAREIEDDLGAVPSFYIASASQMAGGRGRASGINLQPEEGLPLHGGLLYDEWDFRRCGFRKNWCSLIEKRIVPAKGTFVSHTMEKYRGQILQLKRQFEMMRTQQRFVKRQKDGDDIDLDALTEAYADVRAGLVPSERLFVRLQRDERDIAALFLVDMSSSTEGWVGTALKESLVLLSEALHSLGDRYAIYGFSGMRRSRSEIFHVKDFTEPYSEEIKGRIAAISPMDYTRMGPPIRHFTMVLKDVDARVRLLIILTDGKPEDYDDYKGEYAIEDTRHALIEAKAAGIHPFCISIDKEAQDYLGHIFGEINYTFINDVKKLPLRVPEIYRTLTS
ncbi:MAG: VWA domain-containing protein [Deltaproteobacteria bacterium]|nr:VWA domain-containing protein [Deltaproteobacteria bacterium]